MVGYAAEQRAVAIERRGPRLTHPTTDDKRLGYATGARLEAAASLEIAQVKLPNIITARTS
jgi:hypothetical protein